MEPELPPFDRATAKAVDLRAQQEFLLPGDLLMENAGRTVAEHALRMAQSENAERVLVLAGPGNNGGDGFVAARHLLDRRERLTVETVLLGCVDRLRGDARQNAERLRRLQGTLTEFDPDRHDAAAARAFLETRLARRGVVIDALFGTGLTRPLDGPARAWIEAVNEAAPSVLAVDVPSGLDADTGAILGAAIRATLTLTFVAAKKGFATQDGPASCGRVVVAPIGFPPARVAKT